MKRESISKLCQGGNATTFDCIQGGYVICPLIYPLVFIHKLFTHNKWNSPSYLCLNMPAVPPFNCLQLPLHAKWGSLTHLSPALGHDPTTVDEIGELFEIERADLPLSPQLFSHPALAHVITSHTGAYSTISSSTVKAHVRSYMYFGAKKWCSLCRKFDSIPWFLAPVLQIYS